MDYNNPYQNPYQNGKIPPADKGSSLARAAMITGFVALISVPMYTFVPAMVLGAVSITLAILSRGSQKTFVRTSKVALSVGILAMCLNMGLAGFQIYHFSTDSNARKQFNKTFEEFYGESFQDVIKDIMNGQDPSDHTGNSLPDNGSSL